MPWADVGALQLGYVCVVKLPQHLVLQQHSLLVLLPVRDDFGGQSLATHLLPALPDDAESAPGTKGHKGTLGFSSALQNHQDSMLCFSSVPGGKLLHLLSHFAHPPVSLNCTGTLNYRRESLTPLERGERARELLVGNRSECLSFRQRKLNPNSLTEMMAAKVDAARTGNFVSPELTS